MSFFLRNAAGLFIQFYPCVLMSFLPFPKESFRFPRRSVFIGATLCSLAAAAVFPAALTCLFAFSADPMAGQINLAGNLLFLLYCLAEVAAFLWLIRDSVIKKILVLSIVFFYATSQFWLTNLFLPFIPFGQEGETYSYRSLLLYAVTTAVLFPLVITTVTRPVGEFIRETVPNDMLREFWFSMAVTTTYIILMIYCDSVQDYYSSTSRMYCLLFLFLILNQCMVYWLLFRETLRRKREAENQRAMEIQRLQSEKIASEIENASRVRHDMRHHLNLLYEMLEQGKNDEALSYLTKYISAALTQENQFYCQNFTVNALLQYYAGLAGSNQIACQIHAECGDITICPPDLTVLLGNSMENAIHACQQFPDSKDRWISLQMAVINSSLVIELCNPGQGVRLAARYRTETGFLPADAFLSTRTDGGLGLHSLAHTAAKYGGEASFRFDGETRIFTTRIRLNLHPEML